MLICPVCSSKRSSVIALSKHINMAHTINAKELLFSHYPNLFASCNHCGTPIMQYKSNTQHHKFCGKECSTRWRTGKKQPKEVIQKRILNTDQVKKERNRQETMMKKYGSLTHIPNMADRSSKISKKLAGKPHSAEHHKKIIETKTKNNTLKHTQETKEKISKGVLNTVNADSFDRSVFLPKHTNNYKQGWYKGFYCRSSYERKFVDFCEQFNIKLQSAENSSFGVKYEINGKTKMYYPDFYLEIFDLVVEIKPLSMLDYRHNQYKFDAAKIKHRFEILTEEEHLLDSTKWDILYEHLRTI